jgi:capsular exopolysaccharide synthesis family protein
LEERYGYFPFEVTLSKTEAQLYDTPFQVEILSDQKYRLSIEADDFMVSNPANGSIHEVNNDFNFSKEFSFGETVENDYFNFVINKPDYKVNMEDFNGEELSFVLHDQDAVTQAYLNNIEVNNIDIQASIFKIVSYGEVVDKEVEFLNKHTENYIQSKLKSRDKIATIKELFIRDQLNIITDSLFRFESNLETFKRDEDAVDLSKSATNALESTQDLQAARAKINLDIKYYTSLENEIEANRNRNDFVIPTAMGINNSLINENIIALNSLYAERTKKKYYVTENNEEMTILNEQINAATEKLLANLRNAIRSSILEARGLSASLYNYDQELNTLPTREKQLLSIERQSTLYENLFNYLNQELAKTGIARAESTSDTHVLDQARQEGDGPVAPQILFLLVLAVILGILFPVVWTMLFLANDTIESVNQIIANSQIPVVGKIVHFNKKTGQAKGELSLWKVKESFRDLSVNLQFYKSEECCIIGITSIMPKEGKTFCAINLGIAFAEVGHKTLIIDTDLRKPSLVEANDKIKGKGLANYLKGEVSIDAIIHSHETLSNLHFIPTSTCEGNVHELLSSEKMKSLIFNFKESYDYIILDTPAVGLVSDFLLFSEMINVNVFVVRRSIAKLAFLEDLKKLLPKDKKTKGTIIFNDTPAKDYKYGYVGRYGVNKEIPLIDESLAI